MVHAHFFPTEGLISQIIVGTLAVIILIISAEVAVRRIINLLHHYGVSKTFGGLTVFSITTSFPEIFSHLVASWGILTNNLDYKIASATVLGANIGSDVVQQTLVLGLIVLLMGGFTFKRDFLFTAYAPMIGTTLLTLILAWDGILSRVDGGILFGTFLIYLYFLYKKEKKRKHKILKTNVGRDVSVSIIALATLIFTAHLLLEASEVVVSLTGVGGSLIGVVSLGIASAAPEMFTAISGLRQKAAGISLGTLIGSNITNPLVAIGGGALVSTYWVPKALTHWDLPMETITAALLLIYLLLRKGKLGRGGAIYLILLYVAYLAIRIKFFAFD